MSRGAFMKQKKEHPDIDRIIREKLSTENLENINKKLTDIESKEKQLEEKLDAAESAIKKISEKV